MRCTRICFCFIRLYLCFFCFSDFSSFFLIFHFLLNIFSDLFLIFSLFYCFFLFFRSISHSQSPSGHGLISSYDLRSLRCFPVIAWHSINPDLVGHRHFPNRRVGVDRAENPADGDSLRHTFTKSQFRSKI